MTDRPRVENAPGCTWRQMRNGEWEARWRARTDLVRAGYSSEPQRLWLGTELTDIDRAWISDRCNALQSAMLVWGRARGVSLPAPAAYDGTLASLIRCYKSDPQSTYRKLRYRTRDNYDSLLKAIDEAHGTKPLSKIKGRDVMLWHEEWSERGTAMAHGLVGMLRSLLRFGMTLLEDEDRRDGGHCLRLKTVLHELRFPMAKARQERITATQVVAVRKAAHALALPSLALAQALQFDLMLRQKDVIGEWVPLSEPGTSDLMTATEKWLRGLRWSEIDKNLVLRHTTSKRGKEIEVNLILAPMVLEEFGSLCLAQDEVKSRSLGASWCTLLPTTGPVIVCEVTGLPYTAHQFRYYWRKAARIAGVPDRVFNMDSRSGAITEATDAGADLESVRHAATHSDIGMTQHYSRGAAEKTANVMKLRAAHRNKAGK